MSNTFDLLVRLKIPQSTSVSFIDVFVNERKTVDRCWSVQDHGFVVSQESLNLRRAGFCMGFDNVRWVPYICIELFNIKTQSCKVTAVVFVWWEGEKLKFVLCNSASQQFASYTSTYGHISSLTDILVLSDGVERFWYSTHQLQFITLWADNFCKFLVASGCDAYVAARVGNLFQWCADGIRGGRYDIEFLSADDQTAAGVAVINKSFQSF